MFEKLKQSFGGVTKETILSSYAESEVFQMFLGYTPKIGEYYKSPFRKDSKAGCRFEYKNNQLFFIDNAGYKGRVFWDCFSIGCELTGDPLPVLCYKIYKNNPNKKRFQILQESKSFKCDIRIITEKWEENNYFTSNFDIDPAYLHSKPFYSVKDYFVNTKQNNSLQKNIFGKRNVQIGYYFSDTNHIKLYFPEAEENQIKWYSNCNDNDIFNYNMLDTHDFKDKVLIITKSGKDCLILDYHTKIPVIAVQQENSYMPIKILNFLKSRPDIKPIIIFDNSSTDKVKVEKILYYYKDFNFKSFFYQTDTKDTAEFYLKYGKQKLIEIINNIKNE